MKYNIKFNGPEGSNITGNIEVEINADEMKELWQQFKETPGVLKELAGSFKEIVEPITETILSVKRLIEEEDAKDSAAFAAKMKQEVQERTETLRKEHEIRMGFIAKEHNERIKNAAEYLKTVKPDGSTKEPTPEETAAELAEQVKRSAKEVLE